jgi:hypothetical protein
MVPGFDPASAQRRREALVAAIVKFPDERQPAVLREYIDAELRRLAAMEDAHHAFLGECVLLAVDNMQDARLQFVESRLAKLESPDGPTLADSLNEAAIVFGLSIATVVAVEAAGVGLVLLFAAEAAAPAARRAVEAADDALVVTMRSNVSSLSKLQVERALKAEQLRGVTTVLGAFRGGTVASNLWQVGKALMNPIATARTVSDVLSKAFTVAADLEEITAKTLLVHLSTVEGMQTSMAARTAYENALRGDTGKLPVRWRNFLDNATGGIVLQPVQTLMQSAAKSLTSRGTSSGSKVADVFLASTPAGRLLSLMRESRIAAQEDYASLRAALRYRPDDGLLEDPLVAQLLELVTQLTPLRATYQSLQDSVRPLLVRGYEAALWWAYLHTNGMLGFKEGIDFEALDDDHEPGDVVEGHVIGSKAQAVARHGDQIGPPRFRYRADFYAGIPRLTESQAEYLFETFAAPYFSIGHHADVLLIDDFDPANYAGVRAQPERLYKGFIANTERTRRIDEMRLMVILFFLRLPELEDPTSSGLLASLGEIRGVQPSARAWLELNPPGTAPPPPNPFADGSAERAAQAAAPALAAAMADSGVLARPDFDRVLSKLLVAINELRSDMIEAQKLVGGQLTPAVSTRGLDAEDYAAVIQDEQDTLRELYADTLTAAQFDDDELGKVLAMEPLVERYATWTLPPTTTKADGSRFQFQPPAPTP